MTDSQWFEIQPAYGRDYKSAKAANADWLTGVDFKDSATGQYLSIRDFTPEMNVIIRYNKLMRVTNAAKPNHANAIKALTEMLVGESKPVEVMETLANREIPITLSEYNAATQVSEIEELLKPVELSGVFNHPPVVHECKTPAFLLHEVALPALEIRDMDGEIPSYNEFESYAIDMSHELFGTGTIDCDSCEALRMVWLRVQLRFAIHTIRSEQCKVTRDARSFNELARAIKYELEISRDMDSE